MVSSVYSKIRLGIHSKYLVRERRQWYVLVTKNRSLTNWRVTVWPSFLPLPTSTVLIVPWLILWNSPFSSPIQHCMLTINFGASIVDLTRDITPPELIMVTSAVSSILPSVYFQVRHSCHHFYWSLFWELPYTISILYSTNSSKTWRTRTILSLIHTTLYAYYWLWSQRSRPNEGYYATGADHGHLSCIVNFAQRILPGEAFLSSFLLISLLRTALYHLHFLQRQLFHKTWRTRTILSLIFVLLQSMSISCLLELNAINFSFRIICYLEFIYVNEPVTYATFNKIMKGSRRPIYYASSLLPFLFILCVSRLTLNLIFFGVLQYVIHSNLALFAISNHVKLIESVLFCWEPLVGDLKQCLWKFPRIYSTKVIIDA